MTATLSDSEVKRDLVCRELCLRAKSIDKEQRSFEAVVSTEEIAQVYDMRTGRVIDEVLVARGGEFPESTPMLNDHYRYGVDSVIGRATDFRLEGNQWIARGIVGRAVEGNTAREQIWQDVADGIIRAVSIGYQVLEAKTIAPGRKENVNGIPYKAGERTLRVATKWRAHELSLTPIGADKNALIRNDPGEETPKPSRSFFR